jgi:hypothetical protein
MLDPVLAFGWMDERYNLTGLRLRPDVAQAWTMIASSQFASASLALGLTGTFLYLTILTRFSQSLPAWQNLNT